MNKSEEKSYSSIWEYLSECGVLESGSEHEIMQAKKEYRKIYQRQYRRRIRKEMREVRVCFTQKEVKLLESQNQTNFRSFPRLVKDMAISYTKKSYLVPDPVLVGRIEQHLSLIRQDINEMNEREPKGWMGTMNRSIRIRKLLKRAAKALLQPLKNPNLLHDYVATLRKDNPQQFQEFIKWLNYDSKDTSP